MVFIDPSTTKPVSVTGIFCPLNCNHCGGVYLKHMINVGDIEHFAKSGVKSFLISGGMNRNGEIPFERHYKTLKALKIRYDLKYNFHVGFPEDFPEIVEELADVISADFFGDAEVLKQVYGLERNPDEILKILKTFRKPVVPHVTVGILCGRITHEYKAIELLKGDFHNIVLNVFVPTRKTPFENCNSPPVDNVIRVFEFAKMHFKRVFLGCMQPKGIYRKELQEKLIGIVDGITKPVINRKETVKGCCAFVITREHQTTF